MNERKAKLPWCGLLAWFVFAIISQATVWAMELDGCATCHLDGALIDELTEDLITERQTVASSDRQQGEGYAVTRAPFDLYENILVKESFLDSAHGKIACCQCHQGDSSAATPEAAHQGMVKDPTVHNALKVCGGCHQEITRTAAHSLHVSSEHSLAALRSRCTADQGQGLTKEAIAQQCAPCHAGGCGSCHVSRPRVNGGGLAAGHLFQRTPDYLYQCAACHARPIVDDFTGKMSLGDVHYIKGKVCIDCHGAKELHAASPLGTRHALPERARCLDCHQDLAKNSVCRNELHKGAVDCTVCHAQAYENCTSCHMGVDEDDIPYSQSGKQYKGFKIGVNPTAGPGQPRFVLVRQIPVQADSCKQYPGADRGNSRGAPTFKRSTVHNIQRKTWQNANCNHCHGQKGLFLTMADVPAAERTGNQGVIVPERLLPLKIDSVPPMTIPGPKRNESLRVDATWLSEHLKDDTLLILDVRVQKKYEEGHIPGALNLCECFLKADLTSNPPYLLKSADQLAKALGEKVGLTPEQRVIIYDDGKSETSVVFLALERIGHERLAFLDGNFTSWTRGGYPVAQGVSPAVADSSYPARPREVLVDSQYVKANMDKGGMILLDARNVSEYMGHSRRSGVVKKAGRIPGALSLPSKALFDAHGMLKPADELNWIFARYGITPTMEQTIVPSCNTKTLAAELYMVLRYLGYAKVKVHDGSWAEWSRLYAE